MSLSKDRLDDLKDEVLCRSDELDLLNAFVSGDSLSLVPSLIVHGYKSIGKSYTIERYLEKLGVKKSIINCDECVTKKILLQRCLKRIRIDSGVNMSQYNQVFNYKGAEITNFGNLCEKFANFIVALEQFIEDTDYRDQHVLVLDRFDQCMDSVNDLFPEFLKLQEQTKIKNITVIFILSSDIPNEIVTHSVPHIFFRSYNQTEVVEILQANRLGVFGINEIDSSPASLDFWMKYSKLIVDLYFIYTGSDINLLIDIASKLWDRFIEPIRQGKYGVNDFIKIYRENRDLFLSDSIVNNSSVKEFDTLEPEEPVTHSNVSDLPIHSKYILIASYLASFDEPKMDLHFFSKLNARKTKKRKSSNLAKAKKGLISQEDIDNRLLSPNYFDLERLLAIISVIYRNEAPSFNSKSFYEGFYEDLTEKEIARKEKEYANFTLSRNIDLNSQIATLISLGLLARTSASNILNSKVRWKCNISWSTVEAIAKDIHFPLQNYLADQLG